MSSAQDPSIAADQARQRLHEEIERVRVGVEEMLTEQEGGDPDLRRELDALREDTRLYVKQRLRKSEKRTDKRTGKLERRMDQAEQDRNPAEGRLHTDTAAMLDGLLTEVRASC